MQSLQVRTGQISLQILNDEGDVRGIFRFNPEDIESAKHIYRLQEELQIKEVEFEQQIKVANSPEEKLSVLEEIVNYFNGSIDACFGAGSSDVLFGGAKTLTMYEDFFAGIVPYYEKASKARVKKYQKSGK